MIYTSRDLQARVNALSVGKREIAVDGMTGPGTRAAVKAVMKERGVRKESQIFGEAGLHGIIWHWTAARKIPTQDDLKHYNDGFDFEGNHYDGGARPEIQSNYDWRRKIGVSHTRNANTGRIGMSVAGMYGASGWPMNWGEHAVTWAGIDAMLERSALYATEFDIPVTKWSMLSHAEVEEVLGIKQKGKWDFMVLPGYTKPINAVEVGNILRARLIEKFL